MSGSQVHEYPKCPGTQVLECPSTRVSECPGVLQVPSQCSWSAQVNECSPSALNAWVPSECL